MPSAKIFFYIFELAERFCLYLPIKKDTANISKIFIWGKTQCDNTICQEPSTEEEKKLMCCIFSCTITHTFHYCYFPCLRGETFNVVGHQKIHFLYAQLNNLKYFKLHKHVFKIMIFYNRRVEEPKIGKLRFFLPSFHLNSS